MSGIRLGSDEMIHCSKPDTQERRLLAQSGKRQYGGGELRDEVPVRPVAADVPMFLSSEDRLRA